MALNLTNRLTRLELRNGIGTRACPECGHNPGAEVPVQLMCEFTGDNESSTPDRCPECGRRLVLALEFDSRN